MVDDEPWIKSFFPPRIILEGVNEKEMKLYFKTKCNECNSDNIAVTFSFLNEAENKELLKELDE